MIHVLATITTAPGQREALIQAFAKLRPLVLAEVGCIEYGTAIDAETPLPPQKKVGADALMVVEKWESIDHLLAHLDASHMHEFRETNSEIISDISLLVLDPTDGNG